MKCYSFYLIPLLIAFTACKSTTEENEVDLSICDGVFVVVEQMPELIGGQAGLQQRLEYPEVAIRAGIEGRVTVQFVVDKLGNVDSARVIKGIGGGCDEEALRLVNTAEFKPGTQRGTPTCTRMSLPVLFKLPN